MISPKPQLSLRNARNYFRTHLSAGDYYSQKNAVAGEWIGQGAARLNLTQTVSESAFLALCEGNDPGTGKRLTARRNSVRRENGKWVANKRIFGSRRWHALRVLPLRKESHSPIGLAPAPQEQG